MYGHDIALIATPIGMVRISGTSDSLTAISIEPGRETERDGQTSPVRAATTQLREYFAGTRTAFDLPLEPLTTPRGPVLRDAMSAIPYGDTVSYGQVARTIGTSPRAMGRACATNPFPIVVPCHRVTSGSGPEKYSGGNGPETKRWLIDHEHRNRTDA